MRSKRRQQTEADLDITSFMNLMIILVPVLLMSMVFSHVAVLDLTLPNLADDPSQASEPSENKQLELLILEDGFVINYPAGTKIKNIPKAGDQYDFESLAEYLKKVKRLLSKDGESKRDIFILSQPDTDYQTIVTAMDTARSYKEVVVTDVVNAELFPQISLGDAPFKNFAGEVHAK